ncbi:HAD-IA family hydrolase [Alteromonas sp. C1M14]|uniref:HAD-IA family hydrolase n=1 Tax=Alteromonas sp. C1M14 TaxID=2841567 RepID=UPI001C08114E|nr:HAD-IA family hydrolase [Alteromonas sp. C1M14]MBU2980076.1 HAD-IA family hydrolase [Alteromonas sp. C1M14]
MRFYRSLSPIKAMTFDLDDTLYNNEPVIQNAEQQLTSYIAEHYPLASAMSQQQWLAIKHKLIQTEPALASDMGQLRMRTLQQALAQDVSDEPALSEAAKACFDCFYHARSAFTLSDSVHSVMQALAQKVPLVAITNGNVDPHTTGLAPHFKMIFHASVTRPAKPARHMFDETAALLNIKPEQILHVGDNLEKDVKGAIDAGFQAAWFAANRPMDLRKEPVTVLPHVALTQLENLILLVD